MLKYHEEKYWWKGDANQSSLVRNRGFEWDEEYGLWRTNKVHIAADFLTHAIDETTHTKVREGLARAEANIAASWATTSNKTFECPEGLDFLPFQNAGVDFITQRPHTVLADDMGLGKTVQVIGAMNTWDHLNKILIVCPASIKLQWKKKLREWCTKYYDIHIVVGRSDDVFRKGDFEIVIMNFDVASAYRSAIEHTPWDLKIVDEFHYIMTARAQRTIAVLSSRAKKNIFCSGSPGERPIEFWPTLRHLDPENFDNFWHYAKFYCDAKLKIVGKKGSKERYDLKGAQNLQELQYLLRSNIMVRRLKSQVQPQLGEKQKVVVPLAFGNRLATHLVYEEMFVRKLSGRNLSRAKTSQYDYDKAIITLSTEHMSLDDNMAKIRKEIGLIKVPMVIDFLNVKLLSKNKIVCYAYHREVIDALVDYYGNECVFVKGGVSGRTRDQRLKRFQTDPTCRVFIGQIKAVGTGVDGLQEATDTAVYAEIDWSFKNMEQSEDRLHRMGQKGLAFYYYLVVDNSLEAYMAKQLQIKRRNSNDMLDSQQQKGYKKIFGA